MAIFETIEHRHCTLGHPEGQGWKRGWTILIKPDARKKSRLPFLLQCVSLSSLRSLIRLLCGVRACVCVCVCKCMLFNRNERERFNQAKTKTISSGKLKTDEECPLHYQPTLLARPSLFFFVVLRIKSRISQSLIFKLLPSIAIFPLLFVFRNIFGSYLLYKIKFIITDLWKIPIEILIVIVLNLQINIDILKITNELFFYPETVSSSQSSTIVFLWQAICILSNLILSIFFVAPINGLPFFSLSNWLVLQHTKDHIYITYNGTLLNCYL